MSLSNPINRLGYRPPIFNRRAYFRALFRPSFALHHNRRPFQRAQRIFRRPNSFPPSARQRFRRVIAQLILRRNQRIYQARRRWGLLRRNLRGVTRAHRRRRQLRRS